MPAITINQTNASETAKGIVEEATQAEVNAGTDTGATLARLFVVPSKLIAFIASRFTGVANRIPYWINITTQTNDDHFTRDPTTKYTHIGADVSADKHAHIDISNDLNGLGSKGISIIYLRELTNEIFSATAGADALGNESVGLYRFDVVGNQDNFLQITDTKIEAGITDDGVGYTGFEVSDPAGFIVTGKDNGSTNNSFTVKRQNGTVGFYVRNDGLVSTSVGQVATLIGTETFTNKRNTARTGTVASSATPTINTDNVDFYSITALAAAITSFTTNLSGTPTEAQTLWIAITDNGTARAIAWGASFESSTIALPTTTVISTRLDVAFIWNTVTSKWRCVGTC